MKLRTAFFVFCFIFMASSAIAGEIHLFAAASLKEVLNELSDTYIKKEPATNIIKNYGASGTLAKQIENGAPSDIFISANNEWIDYVKDRKLVDPGRLGTFAYNTLVFAGTKKAGGMKDIPAFDKIAIGSPKSVPAGQYAMEALKKAGIDNELEGKLVMARDVREALVYAERGEVDGAFVYKTDALQSSHVTIQFVVPAELYSRVVYPMGLTVNGSKNADAVKFFEFLGSAEAKAVIKKYGFKEK